MSTEQNQSLAVFDTLLADVTLAVKPIFEIEVTDAASEATAQKAGGQILGLTKEIEKRRKELIAPLKAQIDAIDNAARRAKSVLAGPETHIRDQLDGYATELARKREEQLRIQREKEAAERRAAEDRRLIEAAALRAEQEAERQRIQAEFDAKAMRAHLEAEERAAAAAMFGGGAAGKEKAEREAAEATRAAKAQAEAERKALEEQQERERLAEHARIQREADERHAAAELERKDIEAQRVKGAKTDIVVEVLDIWAVPREYLRDPEVKLAEVKRDFKAGLTKIPGLRITEKVGVALRSASITTGGAIGNTRQGA